MANATLSAMLRHIRVLAAAQQNQGRTDAQLLQDFSCSNDQAAFTALVKRHGPLVLGVCRRELRSREDAEDAFQATFFLLARKFASIRKQQSLASWLHGVAYRMAQNAKRAAARRRKHEGRVSPVQQGAPEDAVAWREVQAALDEEVQRLPEAYRAPFILCFLDGRGRAEVAAELGLNEKTLETRLARARAKLQQRLAKRGITLSAVLASAAITSRASAVSGPMVSSVVNAVRALMTGGTVPAKAAALVNEVTKTMFMSKIKILVVCVFAFALVGIGGAGLLPG